MTNEILTYASIFAHGLTLYLFKLIIEHKAKIAVLENIQQLKLTALKEIKDEIGTVKNEIQQIKIYLAGVKES